MIELQKLNWLVLDNAKDIPEMQGYIKLLTKTTITFQRKKFLMVHGSPVTLDQIEKFCKHNKITYTIQNSET